ncbi:MGMT family protein [Candidatus Woesearchaeota archaeon]|nr:MGMT family protein [Candidatus Woesearchaeota archaeon]
MRFNEKVLNLCKKIPKGKVTTYKIIAQKLNSRAYRAVGNALNKNKKPLIVPCHRVVSSDGSLGGYSKGVKEKTRLLKREGIKVRDNKIINFKERLYRL